MTSLEKRATTRSLAHRKVRKLEVENLPSNAQMDKFALPASGATKNSLDKSAKPCKDALITAEWAEINSPFAYAATKRFLDIVGSLVILVLGSPLFLLIALLIKLTSPGPVFYRGTVIGLDGKTFRYFKFRTMAVNGDNTAHRQWLENFVKNDSAFATDESGRQVFKVINDPRITHIGHWLRKLSLDEAPQIFSVLLGHMSLVGPRPPVAYEWTHYDEIAKQRAAVLPGITGLYQVTARSQVGFSGMLAIDLDYIQHRSLWLDLRIMLKTPIVMLTGRGAA